MVEIQFTKTIIIYIAVSAGVVILTGVNIYFMRRMKKKIGVKDLPKGKLKKIKIVEKEDDNLKGYNPLKRKSKFSFAFWREWYLDKYNSDKICLINMELNNGFHRTFLIKEKEEGFTFKGKKYLFDDESKYYNIDAKLYAFDYHEGLVLPVKRKIPLTTIRKTIEAQGLDVEYAINPSTLQRFMTAKIAEGVMKGTQMDEFFRKMQMFLIVTMIGVLVHLALFLYGSGILQNIKIPGIA